MRVLVLAMLALGLASQAVAQDYAAGLRAFNDGRYAEARDTWRPLADAGNVKAQYGLGVIYERGPGGMPRNFDRAAHWYARAAGQGHAAARNNLALMYANGLGVDQSPRRAAQLWEKAAADGHAMAQYNLGLAYYRGDGLEKDSAEAAEWFERAAGQGLPGAQYALGQLYRLGVGVGQDSGMALSWYRRAAAQDHPEARTQLRELEDQGIQAAKLEVREAESNSGASPDGFVHGSEGSTPESRSAAPEPAERVARTTDDASQAGTEPAFRLWLGSAESEAEARGQWQAVVQRFGPTLEGVPVSISQASLGDRTVYRVLAGGFADADAARRACSALRAEAPNTFCQVRPARQ